MSFYSIFLNRKVPLGHVLDLHTIFEQASTCHKVPRCICNPNSLSKSKAFFSSTHVAGSLWVMWDCAISPLVCRLSLALVFAMTFQQNSLMISCLYCTFSCSHSDLSQNQVLRLCETGSSQLAAEQHLQPNSAQRRATDVHTYPCTEH